MKRPADMSEATGSVARVTRQDWLDAALAALVADGVEGVRVLVLAERLGVSRSGFYWHFRDRDDLLACLLDRWRATNTAAIVERAVRPAVTIVRAVLNVFECWADERLFDPALDFAVRDWARRDEHVRDAVAQADSERLSAIGAMYRRHGFAEEDALVRARVLYMMQVGYYVLEIREPVKTRLSHLAAYLRSLTGVEADTAELADFRAFVLDPRRGGSGEGRPRTAW
ncbi:MAG: TetR/AcrR family transcriptional regulator [Rhizobiaceae bacterium]|nr:MAG: TetR/AcrR family transcriptional regulator [Rhizobiaceae bacterium]